MEEAEVIPLSDQERNYVSNGVPTPTISNEKICGNLQDTLTKDSVLQEGDKVQETPTQGLKKSGTPYSSVKIRRKYNNNKMSIEKMYAHQMALENVISHNEEKRRIHESQMIKERSDQFHSLMMAMMSNNMKSNENNPNPGPNEDK